MNESKDLEEKRSKSKRSYISNFSRLIVLVLIVSLVGGFSIGAGGKFIENYYFDEASALKTTNGPEKTNLNYNGFSVEKNNISDVVDEIRPSIVAITNQKEYRDWFNNKRVGEASGSGVVISKDESFYYIVTNNHVIQGATQLLVGINNKTIEAKVVGKDPFSDLAVLKIKKDKIEKEIIPIVLGDSDNIKQGNTAIAIGNPLGYNYSVTVGVISALNRKLDISGDVPLIQTDAAINPGNSGGALINGNGELIGINSAKIASANVEGMGFAIPINYAKPIIKQLIDNGSVKRPYLGIMGKTVTEELSDLYELPLGVVITQVGEGTPAQKADLVPGDVIIKLNETRINSIEKLSDEIMNYSVNDPIELTIIREGKKKLIKKVTLGNRNN
jgi:serine protease Do